MAFQGSGRGSKPIGLRRWHIGASLAVTLSASILCSCASFRPPSRDRSPDDVVAEYVSRRGLPSVAVAVIREGKLVCETAQGVRRAGVGTAVSVRDPYHIGSDTKAMTALLAAMLVEEGKARWDTTVGDVLGTDAAGAFAAVTLEQLLSHTGGIPETPPRDVWLGFFATGRPALAERDRMARVCLRLKPLSAPGSLFRYSNFGYVIAGRMLEITSGRSWEELMRERLFGPLRMEDAGFGPPATGADPPDAPWGHAPRPVEPTSPFADNPPALGPAGTVHASLRDMERYVALYLRKGTDADGNRMVSEDSLQQIYRPRLAGYALGWGTVGSGEARYLEHAGSNTTFVCHVAMAPERGFAVIVMTNRGDLYARVRVGEIVAYLKARFQG